MEKGILNERNNAMRKTVHKVIAILCCILMFITTQARTALATADISPISVNTGTENIEDTEEMSSKEEAYEQILESDPYEATKPNTVKPEIPDTTYQNYFSFDSSRVLKGIFSSTSFYFSIPKYWDTRFVYTVIEYNTSKLITEEVPASLTFMVNNTPVYSCNVSYQEGRTQLVYVTIPIELLKEGYNVLEAVSYVRMYDTEGCTEDQSWSSWINISEDSYVYAGYELIEDNNQISFFPYPFVSTVNPTGEGTAILVSDQSDNSEIAAAMYLMAGMSSHTSEENKISVGLYKDAQANKAKNRIVISLTENLPEELRLLLNDEKVSLSDLSNRVMVKRVKDERQNAMLLIVSDQKENLMEAVHMLLDEERLSQEKISTAYVKANSASLAAEAKELNQLIVGNYKIKDLIGSGITYIGPFHHEEILYLPFGKDYVLSSAGKISLKFRYSENLDFNRSLITVYWGDVPIASKKLLKEYAAGDELTFTMPADVVGTSATSIKIAFDLEIRDLFCTMRDDRMPWAYVTEDSVLYLPSKELTKLSFQHFPSPYQIGGTLSDVMLITSDEPDSRELDLLGKVVALCGENTKAYGDLKVIRANEFTEADSNYNIITVGTSTDNHFLKSINDQLYFAYNESGNAFLSNSTLILSDHYAKEIATFQLLKSPFASQRAILAVGGTGEDTLEQAKLLLASKKERAGLKGDCVLLDSDLELKTFEFMIEEDGNNRPSIGEFVKENKQPVVFTVMAIAAMGMLLLAAVLILLRARSHDKKEDKSE